jgi:hypothetical protein
MWMWTVLWGGVALVGVTGALVTVSSSRLARQVARDAHELFAGSGPAPSGQLPSRAGLPEPVREYLDKALGASQRPPQTLRFRHGGRFRARLDGPWQTIRGEQYYRAEPPAFLWWGRLRMAPGLWVDAIDRGIQGQGRMSVSLVSSLTLFDRSGPELDQGAMLRLLSDFVLLPHLLQDPRYVTWSDVARADVSGSAGEVRAARSATCTLRAPGTRAEVTGTFEFGPDGLPRSFSAERYMDDGKSSPRLLPWSGDYEDYRTVDGLLVPHHFIGYWHVDGERIAYVDFVLEPPQYDVPEPF